jgi:hypothetical protein
MKAKPPPDRPGGDRELEAAHSSTPSLPARPESVHLIDRLDRPTPIGWDPGDHSRWGGPLGPVVYLAGPVSTFEDDRYERALEVLDALMPRAWIIDVRGMFRNSREWRKGWPRVLHGIDRLVFITSTDGTIGRGTAREIFDAHEERLPVHMLGESELVPLESLMFISTSLVFKGRPSWSRAYFVVRRIPFELFTLLWKLFPKAA